MRDQHDLWHTLTGYRGDLLGKTDMLAFTFAQVKHPGVGFLIRSHKDARADAVPVQIQVHLHLQIPSPK